MEINMVEFKKAIKDCKCEVFVHQGQEFYKQYAEYLVEYIEGSAKK